MEKVILHERFNIDWLIRQANGGSTIFEGRNRKQTLNILNNLRKQGFINIHQTPQGLIAE